MKLRHIWASLLRTSSIVTMIGFYLIHPPATAQADSFLLIINGQITFVDDALDERSFVVGDPLVFRIIIDTDAVDQSANPQLGVYEFGRFEVFDKSITADSGLLGILNDVPNNGPNGFFDSIQFVTTDAERLIDPFAPSGLTLQSIVVNPGFTAHFHSDMFTDDHLERFLDEQIRKQSADILVRYTGSTHDVRGVVTSISAAPIPEPSSWLLLSSGLAAVTGWRARRKK